MMKILVVFLLLSSCALRKDNYKQDLVLEDLKEENLKVVEEKNKVLFIDKELEGKDLSALSTNCHEKETKGSQKYLECYYKGEKESQVEKEFEGADRLEMTLKKDQKSVLIDE